MNEQIIERLKVLQGEYDAGQKMLAELDARRAVLTNTLLRIDGAIQVLKELAGDRPAVLTNGAARNAEAVAGLV